MSGIVTPLESTVNDIMKVYEVPVFVIPHPIHFPVPFSGLHNVNRKLKVGYLGELSYKKGIDRFVAISNRLKDYEFKVAGPLIDNISLPGSVEYLGVLSRKGVIEYLNSVDVLLVPSRKMRGWEELFGIVIIEALKLNCIVYASDHIGPRLLHRKHESIFLVDDSDKSWENISFLGGYCALNNNLDEYMPNNLTKLWLELV